MRAGSIACTLGVGGGAGAGAATAVRGGVDCGISAVGREAGTGTGAAGGSAAGTGGIATRGGGSGIRSGTSRGARGIYRAGAREHDSQDAKPCTPFHLSQLFSLISQLFRRD